MDGIADYTFVSDLGEAGNGRLYLANTPERLHLDTPYVGVKVIGGATDEDALRRATRELRAFAAVSSPYLVKLLDAGRDGSTFFYAMEHCPGGSLESPTTELSRDAKLAAVAQAARGAHALHEAGLVHRGINPGTILLADKGARLADLGLALQPSASLSGLGPVANVEYVDPSVLAGQPVTALVDIWALGLTLHKVLTGSGVYGELPLGDPLLAVRRVLSARPQTSSALRPGERALVTHCLAPGEDRLQSALSVAIEIERLQDA